MITIEQIKKNILSRRSEDLKKLEAMIDRVLENQYEAGSRKIRIAMPDGTCREVVDELARLYRANNAWSVELASSRNDTSYDVLIVSPYVAPSFFEK